MKPKTSTVCIMTAYTKLNYKLESMKVKSAILLTSLNVNYLEDKLFQMQKEALQQFITLNNCFEID